MVQICNPLASARRYLQVPGRVLHIWGYAIPIEIRIMIEYIRRALISKLLIDASFFKLMEKSICFAETGDSMKVVISGGFIWVFGLLYRSRVPKMSGVEVSWQRGGGRLNCRSEIRIRRS